MNIFERETMERDESLKFRGILSAWGSFKTVVFQSINSPAGQRYGATIEEPNEMSLVIVCPSGNLPKYPFSALVIRIQAEMVTQGKFAIDCQIEQWSTTPVAGNPPHTEWKKKMSFALDVDHTSLIFAQEKFTPTEAADKLLETLLNRK